MKTSSWGLFHVFTFVGLVLLNILATALIYQVDWGGASMIQAERILLQDALMDPSNERFVFLSDR